MMSGITMTYAEEATGITNAAVDVDLPVAVSFTVETDGRLPSGQALGDAINQVDDATSGAPAYFMVNCAHPTHFLSELRADASWLARVRGVRANASTRSHAELDAAPDLDDGNPVELGRQYRALRQNFRQFNVLGGCCGTDHRHVEQICFACSDVAGAEAAE
jgi:homocysteine S-methyltransferase